jgi:hypothetical protein
MDTWNVEIDSPGLVRFWFEFDMSKLRPPLPGPGSISLDGGTLAYRLLARGAGVTGYDEADCLHLIAEVLDDKLPPVDSAQREPVIDEVLAKQIGNPAWRGIWHPPLNRSGPTIP